MFQKIIKYQRPIILISLIACLFFVFKTSDDPFLFQNTWVTWLFQQFPTGNSIIFNVSIGIMVSCIFYVLIVLLPKRSKALQIKRDSGQFRDVPTVDCRLRRWYHIEVENLHRHEIAHYCLVYLKSIKNLSTGEKKVLPLVELKWEGILTQSVSIPPKTSRCFDGVYVYTNSPNIVHLGINSTLVDDPDFIKDYEITGPGDFELCFVIYSVNFLTKRAILGLHIGSGLNDIRFKLLSQSKEAIAMGNETSSPQNTPPGTEYSR